MVHFSLWPDSPVDIFTAYLFNHQLMGILNIMIRCCDIHVRSFLDVHVFLFLWGVSLGVELLGHVKSLPLV